MMLATLSNPSELDWSDARRGRSAADPRKPRDRSSGSISLGIHLITKSNGDYGQLSYPGTSDQYRRNGFTATTPWTRQTMMRKPSSPAPQNVISARYSRETDSWVTPQGTVPGLCGTPSAGDGPSIPPQPGSALPGCIHLYVPIRPCAALYVRHGTAIVWTTRAGGTDARDHRAFGRHRPAFAAGRRARAGPGTAPRRAVA